MGQPLRACDTPALELAFATGAISQFEGLSRADLITFTVPNGGPTYRFTTWPSDITDMFGNTFSAAAPFVQCGTWRVSKTMVVPEMTVKILADNVGFQGGADIKTQIRQGLFRGAAFQRKELYMPTPGDVTSLGGMEIFAGLVGPIMIAGSVVTLTIRGLNARMGQYAPRDIYQVDCLWSFCDTNCGLSRPAFTFPFAVGSSPAPTRTFIPWASAPADPTLYIGGELTMSSGVDDGQTVDIADADSSGLTLDGSLSDVPAPGDTFNAFQACDYTKDSGSGRSCTDRGNTNRLLDFPFLPPPTTAY